MRRGFQLERTQFIACPRSEVFAFFRDATNLRRITPPSLHFRILQPQGVAVHEGMLIDYQLRLCGVPFHWRSRIESFEPGVRFVDVQLRGPYRAWRHLHEFRDVSGGTEMRDQVDYCLPLGSLGSFAHWAFVRRMLGRIFDYRRGVIEGIFNDHAKMRA
ncbi:MAG TPA: SRPBCC family protein [Pirellulales bacterium]|nr:SRPBCC family protein [Pirellulales bacterium]